MREDDLRTIQAALDRRRELNMERVLGGVHIRITTVRAGPAWRPCVMLARVEASRGNVYSTQYFTSAEEVRRAF